MVNFLSSLYKQPSQVMTLHATESSYVRTPTVSTFDELKDSRVPCEDRRPLEEQEARATGRSQREEE